MITSLVTSNWQLYIPLEVRKALSWDKPGEVTWEIEGKKIILKNKKNTAIDLAGILKNRVKVGSYVINKERDSMNYSDRV